ncbi:MAG: hemolysin III family protein [Acidimicrobiia bacterium]|nr:hemolysin III family protein [Acidimicrobiia bacterium]
MERATLGRMQNPVRGMLHGTAAVLSVAGLVNLIVRTMDNRPSMWSMVFFGVSLILLYTTSSLYHSVPWNSTWKKRMQRLDHSMIFLLIAGSYTPIAYNVLDGRWRSATLAVVWGIAIVGIGQKLLFPKVHTWFSVTLQTTMGWIAVVPITEIARRLPVEAIVFLFLGGLSYTVGMVIFATSRPKLFPRVFSHHELFHVLVVAGSVAHYLVVWLWVVPLVA